MKVPAYLVTPDGDIKSFGELKSYLRAVRYDTAKRWASRKTREELEHIVAAMFARNRVWAGLPNRNEKRAHKMGLDVMWRQKREIQDAPQKARKAVAEKAAKAKLLRDPKQAAKSQARELWNDWQNGKTIHKSGAAFARYVVDALPDIESEESVKRWIRAWSKEK